MEHAQSTSEVVVRRATNADHDSLASLQWRWRVEEWGRTPESSQPQFRAAFRRWAALHSGSHTPFVAMEAAHTVGMAWLALIERVPTPHRWRRLGAALQSVYVVPSLRNSGLGASLVAAALDHARATGVDYVIVHPSERSFPFYRRLGFSGSGQHLELLLTP
jgi:GNAT superfamily N-acetyltransferase